jgi:hypothetical protein
VKELYYFIIISCWANLLVAKLQLPSEPRLAAKVVESQVRQEERALEIGWVGKMFGSHQEKPGNIAGAAICVSLLFLGGLVGLAYFVPNTNNVPIGELMTLFGGIITLALGYLFGKSAKD